MRTLVSRILVLVSVVIVAGCNGGTVDRHALTNDAATIDSVACEGALLARNVAEGKTTANYTREQAEELEIQASNLADALARRHALSSIEQKRSREGEGCGLQSWRRVAASAGPPVRSRGRRERSNGG